VRGAAEASLVIEAQFEPPEKFATASDQLHELVAKLVGTTDFGGSDYRLGLRMLLLSMDYDPHFTEQGRRIAWGQVVAALSSRARAFKSMAHHPGFDRHPIQKPVVITGIPGTGTTALHKLMAVDPQFQGLQTWLGLSPMPRPPWHTWEGHPLFQATAKRLAARYEATRGSRAAHNVAAEEVDECIWVLAQSFVGNLWTCGWSSGSYDAWWGMQSELPAYRYLYRVIQLVGSNEPGTRWLLKNPGHIANLDLLFAIFPDAMVVQTHRDPAKAVPSLCKILIQGHSIMEIDRLAMRAEIMGNREVEKWAKAVRDAEPIRQANKTQIMDVIHADFHRDPIGVVKRIYAFAGLELSPDVEAAMRQRIAADPEASFGKHSYNVADFHLTEDGIRERFGAYMDQFDLWPKG
jgi:hypothetical protein